MYCTNCTARYVSLSVVKRTICLEAYKWIKVNVSTIGNDVCIRSTQEYSLRINL